MGPLLQFLRDKSTKKLHSEKYKEKAANDKNIDNNNSMNGDVGSDSEPIAAASTGDLQLPRRPKEKKSDREWAILRLWARNTMLTHHITAAELLSYCDLEYRASYIQHLSAPLIVRQNQPLDAPCTEAGTTGRALRDGLRAGLQKYMNSKSGGGDNLVIAIHTPLERVECLAEEFMYEQQMLIRNCAITVLKVCTLEVVVSLTAAVADEAGYGISLCSSFCSYLHERICMKVAVVLSSTIRITETSRDCATPTPIAITAAHN